MPGRSSIQETKKEYGRGIIGGILFSLPLLYTMEMWWTGFSAPPSYLFSWIIATYFLLLGYNSYAGMREDATLLEVCWDSVEEIGLSIFVSFSFLLLIGKISFGMSLYEMAGKVIIESMVVAIGISVGQVQLGQKNQEGSGSEMESKKGMETGLVGIFVLAICGAVLVSSSIAPTEEILLIAAEVTSLHIILMMFLSLVLSYATLFMIDFTGTKTDALEKRTIGAQLAACYLAALLVSAGLLYFFGRFENRGLWIILAQIIVLAVPASLGASAGRLLITKA